MKEQFGDELYELKKRVVRAIRNEVNKRGGEISLSTDGNELTLDLSPLSVDYCARFEVLSISGEKFICRDVDSNIYEDFEISDIDVGNLVFIYEQYLQES